MCKYRQLLLVLVEFPSGCWSFHGPNSVLCYNTLWEKVGCLPIGWAFPENLSALAISILDDMNLQ